MQRISEEPLKFCPQCKGEIKRLISAAGIVFKGSGFYATDSKKSQQSTVTSQKKEKKESKGKEVSK
jgi:predicted nucleic acid-binding Zn ribbon protein